MLKDRYGNELATTSSAARDAYVKGCDLLLSASAGTEAAFREAVAADDGFALGHISLARTLQLQGRGAEVKAPRERAVALASSTSAREQSHIALFEKMLTGQAPAALEMIRAHVKSWPRDAMALAPATSVFGLIGFSGKAGREADQLALLEPLEAHYGADWWFQTVIAFAELELQLHERAHRHIEPAMAAFPRNAHGAHIRAHLHYEEGEREAGLAYLTDWARDYPREGQIHCHVSWHLALWSMETGRMADAWRIYDDAMRPSAAWGPQINVLTDCAAFLARAEINGEPRRPERWREIADFAAKWFPNSGVQFADVHSALAFAMAGDGDALGKIADGPKGPAADMVGALARGFGAFARGDWNGAIVAIEPQVATHERVGGSRAQRDLIEYTMTCALLKAGRADAARRFIATRRPQNGRTRFPIAGL